MVLIFFIGGFKVERVPGITNKEVLVQFIDKSVQSTEKSFI